MPKKTRSARGEMVDFDLLKIKSQIASAPKPTDVKKREDFIDRKLRRRVKRVQKKVEEAPVAVDAPMESSAMPAADEMLNTRSVEPAPEVKIEDVAPVEALDDFETEMDVDPEAEVQEEPAAEEPKTPKTRKINKKRG